MNACLYHMNDARQIQVRQRFQGQQLQRSGMENPGDGLADWFVIKHTRDEALSRDLLSKYGFKAADKTLLTKVGILYITEI